MKKTQQLKDLPVRYQRKGKRSKYFEDTQTGNLIHEDFIYRYTASFKATQQQQIEDKRWDLNYD